MTSVENRQQRRKLVTNGLTPLTSTYGPSVTVYKESPPLCMQQGRHLKPCCKMSPPQNKQKPNQNKTPATDYRGLEELWTKYQSPLPGQIYSQCSQLSCTESNRKTGKENKSLNHLLVESVAWNQSSNQALSAFGWTENGQAVLLRLGWSFLP